MINLGDDMSIDALLDKGHDLFESGNFQGASAVFIEAARLGSADACSMLGYLFSRCIIPENPKLSVYWYKKGFHYGDSSCAWNLAMHHKENLNKRWYLYWLNLANLMGDEDAIEELKSGEWWKKRLAR